LFESWNDEVIWGYSGLDFTGQGGFAHATNMRSVADPTTPEYAWHSGLVLTSGWWNVTTPRTVFPSSEGYTYDYEKQGMSWLPYPMTTITKGICRPGERP